MMTWGVFERALVNTRKHTHNHTYTHKHAYTNNKQHTHMLMIWGCDNPSRAGVGWGKSVLKHVISCIYDPRNFKR